MERFAERLYHSLGGYVVSQDPDGILADFLDAQAFLVSDVDVYVRRNGRDGSGWSLTLDPDEVPAEAIWWLGQWVGVERRGGLDEEGKRTRVRDADGMRRGSVSALRGAARQELTGDAVVALNERWQQQPYVMRVRTWAPETPDEDRVHNALLDAKPAALILEFAAVDSWEWRDVPIVQETWGSVANEYDDWAEMHEQPPVGDGGTQ